MCRSHHARIVRIVAATIMGFLLVVPSSVAPPTAAATSFSHDVLTVTSFDISARIVALTFDAGADRGHAEAILNILAAKGVHASFAVTGEWATANPDLVRRIVREGHTLMNHTWDHPSMPDLSSEERAEQLRDSEDAIRGIAGVELRPFFRPPYGNTNDAVVADLAANGYAVNVLWSIDSLGWQGKPAADVVRRVVDNAAPGSVVLMHVGWESTDSEALGRIIDGLRTRAFSFATLADFVFGSLLPMRYYPQTGFWVRDNIRAYWDAYGGLPTFGYPISPAVQRDGMTVQYFERARLEWQPGKWPQRYDVLLGLLGVDLYGWRSNEAPFLRISASSDANCTFYQETGHRLCWGFRDWWWKHGGLAVFGYPISEEFTENGRTVQYFERARFEWHPENAAPWDVLLGHLGRQAYEAGIR